MECCFLDRLGLEQRYAKLPWAKTEHQPKEAPWEPGVNRHNSAKSTKNRSWELETKNQMLCNHANIDQNKTQSWAKHRLRRKEKIISNVRVPPYSVHLSWRNRLVLQCMPTLAWFTPDRGTDFGFGVCLPQPFAYLTE